MNKTYEVRIVYSRRIKAKSISEIMDRIESDVDAINELDRRSIEVVEVKE